MLLKRTLLAGVCACFVLPVWADFSPPSPSTPALLISHNERQKVEASLTSFIEKVWAESPAIKAAKEVIQVALAHEEGADQPLYNPSLVLDAERSQVNTTVIGFNQTLDWGDRRDAQRLVANKQVLMAQSKLQQTKQKVAIETLTALAKYNTAHQMQALGLRRTELMKGFIDTVKQRQFAGDMGALEGALAQVTYSEAIMQQAALDSQLAEAGAALQSVTGLSLAQWPLLPNTLAAPPEQVDEGWLNRLPDLKVLRHRLEMLKARVAVLERETSTTPTVGVRAGREGSEALLGVTLEIPLLVRNDFKAGVRAASYEVRVEQQQYQEAYRRAKASLEGSLARYQNTTRAWQIWLNEGQTAQHEQAYLLEKMWQAGELTATDYLIQAKQNLETQKAATELMGEVWQAAMVWLDASGKTLDWLNMNADTSK